ncbi:MAG: HAD-IA family hydrolase, partial [Candidatus Eremiobacteraeota bacterium]|nr:HAD-IA family hydrolase [Candidatus Eremiobacteraeota bacterium]
MRGQYRAILCDLFGTLVDGNGVALDGAAEFVDRLAHVRWAVVTSCGTNFALRLLRQAQLTQPPVLVSSDDVIETKPSPACYLRAADLLDVPREACLVIEDSSSGIEAGKAAGMDVVGVAR